MYDASEATSVSDKVLEQLYETYWDNYIVKAYNIEQLIKEASMKGVKYININLLVEYKGEFYVIDPLSEPVTLDDFESCLNYYGYTLYTVDYHEWLENETRKVKLRVSW